MRNDRTVPVDEENEWVFFDPDCSMSTGERALVRRLNEGAARKFWESIVSAQPQERHPALLPESHWLSPSIAGPNWQVGDYPGPQTSDLHSTVAAFLRSNFAIAPDEEVHFILCKERIYAVPMGIFLRFWHDFLHLGDEFPFLLHVKSGTFACFGPTGSLSFGKKTDPQITPGQ